MTGEILAPRSRVAIHEQDLDFLNSLEAERIYNALDCCVTNEIHVPLARRLAERPINRLIYEYEQALLAPLFDMMLRGIKVDMNARAKQQYIFETEWERAQYILEKMVYAASGLVVNEKFTNSPKQLKEFFYEYCCFEPIWVLIKGERKESTNAEALDKLRDREFWAKPFVNLILYMRERKKLISVLKTDVDVDGRMRFSFNIGPETGRLSSSTNPFGKGTNAQNITNKLRSIFVADPGKIFVYRDLSSAESRAVAARCFVLTGMDNYLRACDHPAGLHAATARQIWTDLEWPDDFAGWKPLAEATVHHRHQSIYDAVKRIGHAKSYYTTVATAAKHLKMPEERVQVVFDALDRTYPEILLWHQWAIEQCQTTQRMVTALGRERIFYGRRDDKATWREYIANEPQSLVADALNLGLWRTWKYDREFVEMLLQLHDAYLYQVAEADLFRSIEVTTERLKVPIPFEGPRGNMELVIPSDAEVGWNFQKWHPKDNPDGMKKWKGELNRTRQVSATPDILDRVIL